MDANPRPRSNILPLLVIIVLIIALFRVDLKGSIESKQFQENWNYIKVSVQNFWKNTVFPASKAMTSTGVAGTTNPFAVQSGFNLFSQFNPADVAKSLQIQTYVPSQQPSWNTTIDSNEEVTTEFDTMPESQQYYQ